MSEKANGGGRRRNPSLFGPIVLIAIGGYFLLNNLGMLPDMAWNWTAVLQLWPLWLIFIGVNIIVQQAPRPLGGLLSALVGLTAAGVFGYVLFFGGDSPLLSRLNVAGSGEITTEEIAYPADDVTAATVEIDFGAPGATLSALEDSSNLIAGQISYFGRNDSRYEVTDGRAQVTIRTRDSQDWTLFLNPANWGSWNGAAAGWQLGLNPRVETDLTLDVGAGRVEMDLSQLSLTHLELDGGAGSLELRLPEGNYNAHYDASAGSSRIWLPGGGRQDVTIEGSAGSVTLYLPASTEARIEVEGGAGSFSIDDRFTQISGDQSDEGVWETAGYEDATSRINLSVDIGAGSVRVRQP